jgi:hypothetical protein
MIQSIALLAASPLLAQDSPVFLRGDTNSDGIVDISDAVATLGFLFQGSGGVLCLAAADINDDGAVDVSDPIVLLDYLFRGGNVIPPPYPACAPDPDPEPEGLGCALSCLGSCCPVPIPWREEDGNDVRDIRRRDGRIEIELFSNRPFPARALFPILCIGNTEFTRSGPGENGSLNVIVFTLGEEEFAATRSGAASIYYSCREEERDRWLFLDYDKSLLEE